MRANARTRALCLATSIRGDRLPSLVCHSFSLRVSSLYWQRRLQPVVTSPLLPVSFVRSVLLVYLMFSLSFFLVSYLFLVFLSSVAAWSFSFSSFVLLRLSGFLLSRLGIFVLLVVSRLSWLHLRSSDLLRSLGSPCLLHVSLSFALCGRLLVFFFCFSDFSSIAGRLYAQHSNSFLLTFLISIFFSLSCFCLSWRVLFLPVIYSLVFNVLSWLSFGSLFRIYMCK